MGTIGGGRLFQYAVGGSLRARLVRGALGSAGIQAINRVLLLGLGIVLARGLGPDGYGIYAAAIAIMSLLMVLAEGGVPSLLMREVAAAEGQGNWGLVRGALQRGIQFVAFTATSIAGLGLLAVALLADRLDPTTVFTTWLMLLVLPVAALAKASNHGLRGLRRVLTAQALDGILRPMLVIVVVVTLFMAWPELQKPYSAMGAQLIAAMIVLVFGLILLHRNLPDMARAVNPDYKDMEWLRRAVPFTLIGGAGIINSQTDIVMLAWLANAEDVGMYRVAVQGAALVAFGLQSANAVVAPQFSRLYAQGEMARLQYLVTQSARFVLLAAIPIALALILAGATLVSWVFGHEFAAAYGPLEILTVGQLVNAGFGSVGFLLNMTGHERIAANILWKSALLNMLLNALLIPFFGMMGAALATAISLVTWNLFLYREVRYHLNISSTAF